MICPFGYSLSTVARRLRFLVLVVLLLAARRASADDWQLTGTNNGITIYKRAVPGSAIVALKGEGIVDAPVWKVASVLLDTARAQEWVDSLKQSRVVRRLSLTSYIEYNHLGLPLIIKDRDFVSQVQIDVNDEDRSVALIYKPTDDSSVSTTHNVRGEILAGTFLARSIEPGHRTQLTAEIHCDPKGALPAWIVNLFQRRWPQNTFEGIRRQAAKPDVAMPDEFKDVLGPTRRY